MRLHACTSRSLDSLRVRWSCSFSLGRSNVIDERQVIILVLVREALSCQGVNFKRVAIARAILKRPSLVLLDEATSSVDTETEQKIQAALRALCQGHTTFIVA